MSKLTALARATPTSPGTDQTPTSAMPMTPEKLLECLLPEFMEARLTIQLKGLVPNRILGLEVKSHQHDAWRHVGNLKPNPAGHLDLYPAPKAESRDVARVRPHLGKR